VSCTAASSAAINSVMVITASVNCATTWPSCAPRGWSNAWAPAGVTDSLRWASLVKLRTRLLGPLTTLATQSATSRASTHRDSVNTAFHQVDAALDHLSVILGFKRAA
jgi:hypothetical protein